MEAQKNPPNGSEADLSVCKRLTEIVDGGITEVFWHGPCEARCPTIRRVGCGTGELEMRVPGVCGCDQPMPRTRVRVVGSS